MVGPRTALQQHGVARFGRVELRHGHVADLVERRGPLQWLDRRGSTRGRFEQHVSLFSFCELDILLDGFGQPLSMPLSSLLIIIIINDYREMIWNAKDPLFGHLSSLIHFHNLCSILINYHNLINHSNVRQSDCPDALYQLMMQCWRLQKDARPGFGYILQMLTSFRDAATSLGASSTPSYFPQE